MKPQTKADKNLRQEMALLYDLAKDAGQRPYTYLFDDDEIECKLERIAVDIAIRSIWVETENKRLEEQKTELRRGRNEETLFPKVDSPNKKVDIEKFKEHDMFKSENTQSLKLN